mmetsp:Transcript_124375/g.175466  ORF Transcript_124375/g.175466 Transcript_124375/m.175466 type:complete len:90 (-) Transcript_124375:553-822(-)
MKDSESELKVNVTDVPEIEITHNYTVMKKVKTSQLRINLKEEKMDPVQRLEKVTEQQGIKIKQLEEIVASLVADIEGLKGIKKRWDQYI